MSTDLLRMAASGMDAQRAALDVAARNVAAAEASGPDGFYTRSIPQFVVDTDDEDGGSTVRFAGTTQMPGTNVDILTEMIAVMDASRSYESDASLFDVGKTLVEKTLDMGRLS